VQVSSAGGRSETFKCIEFTAYWLPTCRYRATNGSHVASLGAHRMIARSGRSALRARSARTPSMPAPPLSPIGMNVV
jgi:hypothetical protein